MQKFFFAFLARTQVGVAVEGGADAAIAACRDIARTLPPDHVIVKIDQRNAFNSVLRSHMLDIIGARFPVLYPYARAAYGTHSRLYFGPHVIESQRGVQQGCPLGPLFFSLVMAEAREAARVALRDAGFAEQQITFEAWFLDDGTFAGSAAAAEAYVNALEQACAAYGLEFNRAKCEVILPADGGCGLPEGSFRDFQRLSADNFELLGVPCGDDASVQRTCERLAERVCERIARIGQLYDPQVVYALLRHCGGFPLANFMARAARRGGVRAHRRGDDARVRGGRRRVPGGALSGACPAPAAARRARAALRARDGAARVHRGVGGGARAAQVPAARRLHRSHRQRRRRSPRPRARLGHCRGPPRRPPPCDGHHHPRHERGRSAPPAT